MSISMTTGLSQQSSVSGLSRRSSSIKTYVNPPAKSIGSEFHLDAYINDDEGSRMAFEELKLINEISRQFRIYTNNQQKQFLIKFLNICERRTLKEFHLYLEPLEHRDFCIKAEKDYPKWVKLDEKHRIIFSSNEVVKKNIRNRSNTNTPSRRTPVYSLRRSSILNQAPSPAHSMSTRRSFSHYEPKKPGTSLTTTHELVPEVERTTIDTFLREKSLDIVKKPWDFNREVFKPARNKVNTDSLLEKLKAIFREHFSTKNDEKKKSTKTSVKKTIKPGQSEQKPTQRARVSVPRASLTNAHLEEDEFSDHKPSIYLQKLSNNFYDRKLWNSLDLSTASTKNHSLNLFPDTSRTYTNEFTIVQRYDWRQSQFGKTLSKYSILPKIPTPCFIADNESTTEASGTSIISDSDRDQLTKSREESRLEFLELCKSYIEILQDWSGTRKLTLLAAILKYCNDSVLLFLRDAVKQKIKPLSTKIDVLPDNILLKIFQRLNVPDLESVEKVCQRWNYLVNTDEFWIYKCKVIGKQEKLYEIETAIYQETQDDEEIDWRTAYTEIERFVKKLKLEYNKTIAEFETKLVDNSLNSVEKIGGGASGAQSRKDSFVSSSQTKVSTNVSTKNRYVTYVNFYTEVKPTKFKVKKTKPKPKKPILKSSSSYIQQAVSETMSETNKDTSTIFEGKILPHEQELLDMTATNVTEREVKEKKQEKHIKIAGVVPDVSEEFEEARLELKQAKDLLGKVVPAFKLRWKLEDETNDDLKTTEKILFNLKPINQVRNLRNHQEGVTCIDFDKRRLVSGSMDRSIIIFDIRNGQFISKLQGHKGGIRCLKLLVNRLCSGSWDCTIRIWNLIKFQHVFTIYDSQQGSVSCLDFDFTYLMAGSHDTSIRVWKFDENYSEENTTEQKVTTNDVNNENGEDKKIVQLQRVINHHKCGVTSLKYDGINCIISSNIEGSIMLIDVNGDLLYELRNEKYAEPITCIKLVGALIMASTIKGKVAFWNRFSNNCEALIQCHNGSVNSLTFLDERFYTAGDDGLVKEYDLRTLTCLRELKCHNGPVNDVRVSDVKILTCGADKLVKIWEMTTPINALPKDVL